MGWGRTVFLGDIGNRLDIADCEKMIQELHRAATKSNRTDQSHDNRLAALERENDELKLYLATLVRLLVSKETFSAEEFRKFVDVIDGQDGVTDGRFHGDLA